MADPVTSDQSPETSSGLDYGALLTAGISAASAAIIANNTEKPTVTRAPSEPVNMKLLLGIGAGVLVLIIALFAFKK